MAHFLRVRTLLYLHALPSCRDVRRVQATEPMRGEIKETPYPKTIASTMLALADEHILLSYFTLAPLAFALDLDFDRERHGFSRLPGAKPKGAEKAWQF
jgi:hypothetical protein